MTRPDKVWTEATATLDGENPGNPGIYATITGQPVPDAGYVYAQCGWLDDHGNAYPLRLPDNVTHAGTALRGLYVCLGKYCATPDVYVPGLRQVHPDDAEPCA